MATTMPYVQNAIGDTWDAPVKGPSSAFAILFAITGIWHVWQNTVHKTWLILWLIPCACIILIAGCIVREWSAFHPDDDTNLSAIEGLFYSGPVVIATSLYMILYLVVRTKPQLMPLHHRIYWIIWNIFLSAIISLLAQGSASFFNPNVQPGSAKSGRILLETSLVLMLFLSVCFLFILGEFHRRFSKSNDFEDDRRRNMNIVIGTLYVTGLLMLIRNIFCTAQIFSSTTSLIWRSEAPFWVLDVTPMLLCLFIINILFVVNVPRSANLIC